MWYGIGDRFELRLGWNYETGRERLPGAGDIAGFFGANAEQQMYYGFKGVVTKQSGWMPGSAVLVQGHTPTGGPQSVTQLRAWLRSGLGTSQSLGIRCGTAVRDRQGPGRRLSALGSLGGPEDPVEPIGTMVHARRVLRRDDTGQGE